LEQIRAIDRLRFSNYIGHAPKSVMSEVDKALSVSVGLDEEYISEWRQYGE
jgi:mRNA-degrading endonuclease toxin of MazEF toxin-antitoxin module